MNYPIIRHTRKPWFGGAPASGAGPGRDAAPVARFQRDIQSMNKPERLAESRFGRR